jgi:tripartite-type tricarboxylate transporter receptor subunit TctC
MFERAHFFAFAHCRGDLASPGFPELVVTAWYGLVVAAGTPAAIVARLNQAVNATLAESAFRDKLVQNGADAAGGTPRGVW